MSSKLESVEEGLSGMSLLLKPEPAGPRMYKGEERR